ncbi:MAG: hypothetical protein CSA36_05305 [Draconibacterium sp.]|nr:MAG: hypothetical protein CSA36_05305 [Draconibacterium sp.]
MGKKIVAFGEVVWDILPNKKILGGTPLNMVFRSNSFNDKGFLLSRVGDDMLGAAALERLKDLKIADENVQIDSEFPTGTVNITLNDNKEAIFHVTPDVAFDHIEFSSESLKLVRNADCFFYGLLPQRFGLSKNTLRELLNETPDSIHFLDLKLFEHFFDVTVVEYLLNFSDIVRIKEKDILFLSQKLHLNAQNTEQFSEGLLKKYNLGTVLITRGSNGIAGFNKHAGAFCDPGYNIIAVDNIGSGIAFCAGFLHYHLNGFPISDAIKFGNAAGALNTTKRGAIAFFGKKDVLDFMEKTPQRPKA